MKNLIHFLILGALIIMSTQAFADDKNKEFTTAIFAGGCFWCMQGPFDKLDGVTKTVVGYTGGTKENPSYEETSTGNTGHTEAIEVYFNPEKITYEKLLSVFWKNIDPTDSYGQFCDKGNQYRAEIFYQDDAQKVAAEKSKAEIEKTKTFKEPVVIQITKASKFYPAEDYHQDYYKKNPIRYKFYRSGCGRDRRLRELWGE